jgi:aminocyclopropanecarboxylate oxidase
MVVPVIDFSKLDGAGRAETMAQIANGCEEWGFFQVQMNHMLKASHCGRSVE